MGITRALLVDDDPADALLVTEELRDVVDRVHHVTHVTSLRAAAEAAEAERFHVVLLDLTMPGTRGADTVTSAKQLLPDIPIVVLSGVRDAQIEEAAIAAGAEDYLVKGRCDGELISRTMAHAAERHRIKRELRRLLEREGRVNEQLRHLNQLQEEFVAVASHELRTPVTIATGFVDVLVHRRADISDEDAARFAERAQHALHRLVELTDDLLTISRIGAGGATPVIEAVDLETAVGEGLAQSDATEDEVTISVPAGTVISADRLQLSRIVRNLLDNALRHGRAPIDVRAQVVGDSVELTVTDSGDGVPPNFVPQLFDRFAQADRTVSRERGGTGLGLAIVAGLVEGFGGAVRYEPGPTGGASFVLTLPTTSRLDGGPGHPSLEHAPGSTG